MEEFITTSFSLIQLYFASILTYPHVKLYIYIYNHDQAKHQLVYETPLFVGQGNLIGKVYGGIHTLPPFGFELVTS